jgi:hypothetical protein
MSEVTRILDPAEHGDSQAEAMRRLGQARTRSMSFWDLAGMPTIQEIQAAIPWLSGALNGTD